jgi:hypothetical protein
MPMSRRRHGTSAVLILLGRVSRSASAIPYGGILKAHGIAAELDFRRYMEDYGWTPHNLPILRSQPDPTRSAVQHSQQEEL